MQNYIKETRAEFAHVKWLTRTQVIEYTALVIGVSVVVALFLSAFDLLFIQILSNLITR